MAHPKRKEEHIIKQLRHRLLHVLQQENLTYTIEHIGMKVNYIIEVKF